jgi:peptidoglycan/xylan/chitin deacetylase (PgdA/CDA1 family)
MKIRRTHKRPSGAGRRKFWATQTRVRVLSDPLARRRSSGTKLTARRIIVLAAIGALVATPFSAAATPAAAAECSGWVALTFDDGPSYYRPMTLQTLRDKRVPATFFNIGVRVDANPHISAFEQRDSHLVLNHTYTHPRLSTMSARRVRQQIVDAERALRDAGVIMPFKAVREPFGAVDAMVRQVEAELDYVSIGATVGAPDFLPTQTAAQLVNSVVPRVVAGSVIIMHDGPIDTVAGPAVREALPQIIDQVRAKGLCFGLVNAQAQPVPAEYQSSGEPIPGIVNPVPFRPLAFGGGAPAGPYRILPPDLPAFDNLEDLLGDLRVSGQITASTATGLSDRLSKARRLAEQGSETRTIGYLEQFVDRANNQIKGDAADIAARDALVAAARAIIATLRAAEQAEGAAA